jgi:hypothetical protein
MRVETIFDSPIEMSEWPALDVHCVVKPLIELRKLSIGLGGPARETTACDERPMRAKAVNFFIEILSFVRSEDTSVTSASHTQWVKERAWETAKLSKL